MEIPRSEKSYAHGTVREIVQDVVYPVFVQDAFKSNRVLVSWVMRFNDVLDADKLQSSLARLLEIGDWRKLGGRLRENVR